MTDLIAIVASVCALFGPTVAFAAEDFDAKLRKFEKAATAAEKSENRSDELAKAAVTALEKGITVHDLPKLEEFAREHGRAWFVIPIFVRRSQFDPVARLATGALSKSDNRGYSMWKWWETMFGERADYMKLSKNLGLAFASLYEKSDHATRTVIADIFDKKPMPAEKFRRFIEGNTKGEK